MHKLRLLLTLAWVLPLAVATYALFAAFVLLAALPLWALDGPQDARGWAWACLKFPWRRW